MVMKVILVAPARQLMASTVMPAEFQLLLKREDTVHLWTNNFSPNRSVQGVADLADSISLGGVLSSTFALWPIIALLDSFQCRYILFFSREPF